jgi:hypothetical protein
VVDELSEAGIATAEDARQLQARLMMEESCPLFHAAVEILSRLSRLFFSL